MEHNIKFNHGAKLTFTALGLPENEGKILAEKLTEVANKFCDNDDNCSNSHLSELIINKLSLEEILVLATMQVKSDMERSVEVIKQKVPKELRELLKKVVKHIEDSKKAGNLHPLFKVSPN